MNRFEGADLTTSGQLGTGNPSVGSRSPSILIGIERSGTPSVEVCHCIFQEMMQWAEVLGNGGLNHRKLEVG